MREKKKKIPRPSYCVLVGRGEHQGLVKGTRRPAQQASETMMVTEEGLKVELSYPF